jgi:hypothetical protein
LGHYSFHNFLSKRGGYSIMYNTVSRRTFRKFQEAGTTLGWRSGQIPRAALRCDRRPSQSQPQFTFQAKRCILTVILCRARPIAPSGSSTLSKSSTDKERIQNRP